jgi:hypothetical protein
MVDSLILRRDKGSALTYDEMDDNFVYLEENVPETDDIKTYIFGDYSEVSPWINQGTSVYYHGIVIASNYDVGLTIAATNSINLDFSGETGLYTRLANGNIIFTASNYRPGVIKTIRVVSDSTIRTLTFPTSWVFVNPKPSATIANATGILTVTSFGTTEADCVATWLSST